MLTFEPFAPQHFREFDPGDLERGWLADTELDPIELMSAHPTLTVMRDGVPHAFVGLHRVADDMHVIWSMWSAAARREPLAFSRWMRRNGRKLSAHYGVENPIAVTFIDCEARLAAWLGLRRDGLVEVEGEMQQKWVW